MSSLINWWDNLVYRLFFNSLTRIMIRSPATTYLFEAILRSYREKHPIPEKMMSDIDNFVKMIEEFENVD